MKKMNKSVKIILKNQDAIVRPCAVFPVNSDNCKLKDVSKDMGTLLILIEHQKILTLLDVSGIENYLLLSFDERKKFVGTTYCHTVSDNSFIVSSQAKFAVLIDFEDASFDVKDICELETEFNTQK